MCVKGTRVQVMRRNISQLTVQLYPMGIKSSNRETGKLQYAGAYVDMGDRDTEKISG